jgi:hypothetical protein
MKRPGRILVGALALSAALFAGCRSQPIYEVVGAPVPVVGNRLVTLDEVQQAIVRGGSRAGWQMSLEAPGRLAGRYQGGRGHTAVVGIEHDTKTYSIKMRDTTVRSDGESVHRAYNMWVQNLDRSIRVELAAIGQ